MTSASGTTISQASALSRIERATRVRIYFPASLELASGTPNAEEAALRAAEGHDATMSVALAACCRMSARRFVVNGELVIYPYDDDEATRVIVRSDRPS